MNESQRDIMLIEYHTRYEFEQQLNTDIHNHIMYIKFILFAKITTKLPR